MADVLQSFANLQAGVEQARSNFEAGKAKLFTAEGKPIYAPEEQGRRIAALLQPVKSAVESAVSSADRETEWAKGQREAIEHADPAAELTPDELQAVNIRASFVREDVKRLGFDVLAARVRAAITNKDRPGMFLLERYAGAKATGFFTTARERAVDPMAGVGLQDLQNELPRLAQALHPGRADKLAQHERVIAEAIKLRAFADRSLAEADGRRRQQQHNFAAAVQNMF